MIKIRDLLRVFKEQVFAFIQWLNYPLFLFFKKLPEYFVITKINEIEIRFIVSSKRALQRAKSDFASEPELIELIDSHSAEKPFFLDIGANIGSFSLYAAKKGFEVISIEPNFMNSYSLSRNIHLNHLSNKITPLKLALSNYVGVHDLIHHKAVEAGNSGATIESYYSEASSDSMHRETVLVDTVDGIISRFGVRPTIVKIDTDGNELNILKGSVQLLKSKSVKNILIEVSSIEEESETIGFLSGFNYLIHSEISKSKSIFMKNLIFRLN
jgi:FkbM family methyltransferase